MYSIDPGISGTGWAQWWDDTPLRAGVIRSPSAIKNEAWWVRSQAIVEALARLWGRQLPVVVCEFPQHMLGVKATAAQKDSDIYKLAHMTGMIQALVGSDRFVPVRPIDWKGQLPKSVVQLRVTKQLGAARCRQLNIKSHAWDAVGIGLWFLGSTNKLLTR